jgi:hypothetical protein
LAHSVAETPPQGQAKPDAALYDDPVLKKVLSEFDGKVVDVVE